mgnify:CR=1 FL=1
MFATSTSCECGWRGNANEGKLRRLRAELRQISLWLLSGAEFRLAELSVSRASLHKIQVKSV